MICTSEFLAAWEALALGTELLGKLFKMLNGRLGELRSWISCLLEQDLPQNALRLVDQFIREGGDISSVSDLLELTLLQLGLNDDAYSLRLLASETFLCPIIDEEETIERWSLNHDCYVDGIWAIPAKTSRCIQAREGLRNMYCSVNVDSFATIFAHDSLRESSILFLQSFERFNGLREDFSERIAFKLIKIMRKDPKQSELVNSLMSVMSIAGWRRQVLLSMDKSDQGQFTDLAGLFLSKAIKACNHVDDKAKVQFEPVCLWVIF